MFRRFVMLSAVAVFVLGFSVGCGGAGEATTIERDDRPKDLRQDTDGIPNKGPEGGNLPEGVTEN